MSSFNNLKNAIESFESDSENSETLRLKKIDEAFQNIVIENQSDLIKSLDLVEDFLVKTLEGQRSLNKLK